MSNITFSGPLGLRVRSFLTLAGISVQVGVRHLIGIKMAPDWTWEIETGIRFWRRQFTRALGMRDMTRARDVFDSLLTETDDIYDVSVTRSAAPDGHWFTPREIAQDVTILYFHGGGYTFNGPVSMRFASMLAHHTRARLFMPSYRKTPEHPHPAQAEDARTAWAHVTADSPAEKTVVIGDSAGGHMALMLLHALRQEDQAQPALCIGICPWTDIGARGESLVDNDRFDLVQGWMALKFGEWLDPGDRFGRDALSPISHSYSGLAPIYLLAGGREVLRDMIVDFARVQAGNGADVMLDLWPDMPHNFLAYDSLKSSSTEALARVRLMVEAVSQNGQWPKPSRDVTCVAAGCFERAE